MTTRNPPTEKLLKSAIRAVSEACAVTRAVQAELSTIAKMTKDDRSPVTVADFAAQAIVCQRLHDELGPIDLVGEETAADLRGPAKAQLVGAVTQAVQQARPDLKTEEILNAIDFGNHDASNNTYWTLDPVDGTKGFLRNGQYAVSLALIENGIVTLGVLGCPNMGAAFERQFDDPDEIGCLYYATLNGGAWYLPANQVDGQVQAISANPNVDRSALKVCESVEAGHSKQDDTARIMNYLKATSAPARLDSQCKYAVVGRGQADAYLRLPTHSSYQEKIWDHAAGKIVAEQAGAIVTDAHGKALDFSQGPTLKSNKGIICTAPEIHSDVIDAIKSMGLVE